MKLAIAIIAVLLVIAAFSRGAQLGVEAVYTEFRDGQAQVITYTVPGQGECKAVMVNGERHAEKCEGEK